MADEQVVSCGPGIWSCTTSYEIRFIVLSNQSQRRVSGLIEITVASVEVIFVSYMFNNLQQFVHVPEKFSLSSSGFIIGYYLLIRNVQ